LILDDSLLALCQIKHKKRNNHEMSLCYGLQIYRSCQRIFDLQNKIHLRCLRESEKKRKRNRENQKMSKREEIMSEEKRKSTSLRARISTLEAVIKTACSSPCTERVNLNIENASLRPAR